jgi:hypothetical protein
VAKPLSLRRILAAMLGVGGALNGAFMLSDSARWYDSIPGVAHTGPYNPHFVADIGAAYLAASLALVARAWRPRYWPAALAGAGFLAMHALIHVADLTLQRSTDPLTDIAAVIVPSALALWAALPEKGEVSV